MANAAHALDPALSGVFRDVLAFCYTSLLISHMLKLPLRHLPVAVQTQMLVRGDAFATLGTTCFIVHMFLVCKLKAKVKA